MFESVCVLLIDGRYIDVPSSVPELALPKKYSIKKHLNMEQESSNSIRSSNISYIKNEVNMKINSVNNKNKQDTTRYNNSNLITEK